MGVQEGRGGCARRVQGECAMGVGGGGDECARGRAVCWGYERGVPWVCKGLCTVCVQGGGGCTAGVRSGVQGVQDECAKVSVMGVQGVQDACAEVCAMGVQRVLHKSAKGRAMAMQGVQDECAKGRARSAG